MTTELLSLVAGTLSEVLLSWVPSDYFEEHEHGYFDTFMNKRNL